jgi:hypothetical protein
LGENVNNQKNRAGLKRRFSQFSGRPADCEQLECRRLLTGTWTTLTNAVPNGDGVQYGVVLTDGSIMAHGGGGAASTTWYKLTPSSTGSYTAGTWSTLASSPTARLYTATEVLQSGKVMSLGGEYGANNAETFSNTGEIYDPVSNTWTAMAKFPQSAFGDDPSELLPNGTVLAGYISGPQTYIYNPTTNTWAATGTKLLNDASDEEGWVTLPDHSILSYDVFASVSAGVGHSQRYIPSTGTWVDAGNLPAQLSSATVGYELGPGMLLPDGRVFYEGATNASAYYTPSTNTWAAGPVVPGYVAADAPGAVLPNGNVLLAMSPLGNDSSGGYNFPSPTKVYELNTTTNVYTDVTPNLGSFYTGYGSYVYTFTVLPSGQVAMFGDQGTMAIYTESGSPVAAAVPVISAISYSGTTGVYTLSGTNLNGIDEGASYGDDNEMSSNYPLIRLTDASGNVTYARSTNWSLTGVVQGAETVTFTLPAGDTAGAYLVQSVANGVPSATALAVLVNANTTTSVAVQTDLNTANVDVVGSSVLKASFPFSAFSTIYVVGDNNADTLSVKLGSTAGSTITYVQAGNATDTINVNQTSPTGWVTIDPSTGNDLVNVGTAGAGTAIAKFFVSQQIGALTVGSGGQAVIDSTGTKKLLQLTAINTSGTGFLDLGNNYIVVHGGNLGTLIGEISTGLNLANGGYWNGAGILSSSAAAAAGHLGAIGIIQNNNAGTTIYGASAALGLFDGYNPSLTDVLIKYTYFGDANLDGMVDGSDYTLIDNGFTSKLTGWYNGDFDYSSSVNGSDYTLVDNAFNTQGAKIAAQIADDSKPAVSGALAATTAAAIAVSSPAWNNWTAAASNSIAALTAEAVNQKKTAAASFLFSSQPIA